jgi:hypothetical protein
VLWAIVTPNACAFLPLSHTFVMRVATACARICIATSPCTVGGMRQSCCAARKSVVVNSLATTRERRCRRRKPQPGRWPIGPSESDDDGDGDGADVSCEGFGDGELLACVDVEPVGAAET